MYFGRFRDLIRETDRREVGAAPCDLIFSREAARGRHRRSVDSRSPFPVDDFNFQSVSMGITILIPQIDPCNVTDQGFIGKWFWLRILNVSENRLIFLV